MVELWSINRVLRWTGFRLIVAVPTPDNTDPKDEPCRLGLRWVGLYGSPGWMKWEPQTKPFWRRSRRKARGG